MIALLTALLLGTNAYALPAQFTHQGRLLDGDGEALLGDATITFRVTNADSGGDTLWAETLTVPLNGGFYSAVLGVDEEDNPLDIEILSEAPLWLELQLEGEPAMFPRSPINAVPYATMAMVAEEISGGPVDASQIAVDGIPVVNELGEWVGPATAVSWSAIEGIPEDFADGIDDDTDTDSFAVLGTSCLDGDIPVWDAVATQWACDIDQDMLADIGCIDGQLIRWSGDAVGWICADDADTMLSESEVDDMVSDNGYAMASEVFSGSFLDLVDVAPGLADGDDDTQLTSDEVDDIVSDNGYAMSSEVFTGSFTDLTDVPAGLSDGDTTLSETEVDDMVSDNGYAMATDVFSGSFDDLSGIPEGIGNPLSIEPFSLSLSSYWSGFNDGSSSSSAVPVSHGFYSNSGGLYTKLQIRTNFADAGGVVWFGLYTDVGGRPTTRLSTVSWIPEAGDSEKIIDIPWILGLGAQTNYHLIIMNFGYTQIHKHAENSVVSMTPACSDAWSSPPATIETATLVCGWANHHPFWFRLLP